MSAFRAGHLRKAPVAAVMIDDGRDDGIRATLGLATGNPQLIRWASSFWWCFSPGATANLQLFNAACGSADLDVTSRLFSCPSNFYYGESP